MQVTKSGGAEWLPAQTNMVIHAGERIRTGPRSRATIRLSNLTVMRVNELTTMEIRAPRDSKHKSQIGMQSGTAYFLGRDRPAEQEFYTPLTSGAIRGTEFNIAVAADGRSEVSMIDGIVTLSNSFGAVTLNTGEKGTVDSGQPPVKSPLLDAVNVIQWSLYYPAVIDPGELKLSGARRDALTASLVSYEQGDLLAAAAQFPTNLVNGSDQENIYQAATLLSVGQVAQAEELLGDMRASSTNATTSERLADALRELIATVRGREWHRIAPPELASEWLAESYYLQGKGNLTEALAAARKAVSKSPRFGFGWARVAELEFSFGNASAASSALDRSLLRARRNAQAIAVRGFVSAAKNHFDEAQEYFTRAIALDGALGNAWLGRGLCRIHRGSAEAGREDLQVAAVLEPRRSVLRSYLGKAFSNAGDNPRAERELGLAVRLDPNDPTAWLYKALLSQQQNRVNESVRELEKSEDLNDNRRLFRSKLLLDQDQAVRSANLAGIYRDAGMTDWSVREATRAVNYDYANYSAHEFLANSYQALRDPRQINLRYETPWLTELLVANLLAPANAGNLSQYVSQQEYSRLFAQNHFGFSSSTEFLSHGDWLEQASQYGNWNDVSYSLDAQYRSERGWRPNNDVEQQTYTVKAKDQLTAQDSIFVEGLYYDSTFGDSQQYYNQGGTIPSVSAPSTTFRGSERQQPNIFLGYHHEWAPGVHTLLLAGHLDDQLRYSDPFGRILFTRYTGGAVSFVRADPFSVDLDRSLSAYTADLQQILQTPKQTLVAGARFQSGDNETTSLVRDPFSFAPISTQNVDTELQRYSFYAYETLNLADNLQFTAGISYDHLRYPRNIDTGPITSDEADIDQVSPKLAVIWSPTKSTHLRAAYSRSLGGVFYDNSVRLEPTQLGGFDQAYRSLIPESAVGLVPGTRFTTYGIGLDQSFRSNTYFSVEGEILSSDAERTVGVLTNSTFLPVADSPGSTRQSLNFEERSVTLTLNRLVGKEWSLGGRYRLSQAELTGRFLDVPTAIGNRDGVNQDQTAVLHQLNLFVNYYHPSGFFSQAQGLWTAQSNSGYSPDLPGDDFWQFNLFAGYRFWRRSAEIRLGLLNVADQDYRVNPLNLFYELPRQRTLAVSFKCYF